MAPPYSEKRDTVITQPVILTTEEKIERDRELLQVRKKNSELKAKYDRVLREDSVTDRILAEARDLLPRLTPCEPPAPMKQGDVEYEDAGLLRWADWHGDEIVDLAIMEGLNEYGPAIVTRRVMATIDKTVGLLRKRMPNTYFRDLHVHDLGDGITGWLHEENMATNAAPPFRSLVFIAHLKASALRDLCGAFEHVYFRGVPGNHWRYLKKVPWKLPTENSDWLIYQLVQALLADVPNISFDCPAAWSVFCEIEGHGFALNHGYTDAKGGFGGIPYYSLTRSDAKRSAIDARLSRRVSYREYGHLHDEAKIPRAAGGGNLIICPSLKGGDEYAKEGLGGLYSDPAQLLSAVNRQHGVWWTATLDVNDHDDALECRYDPTMVVLG